MALILYAGNEDARGAVDALQPIFDRKLALPSPVRMKVYLTYGMALVELDRLDEAIRAFREAEKEDKRNALLQAELKKALALKASRREVPLPPRPVDNQ